MKSESENHELFFLFSWLPDENPMNCGFRITEVSYQGITCRSLQNLLVSL